MRGAGCCHPDASMAKGVFCLWPRLTSLSSDPSLSRQLLCVLAALDLLVLSVSLRLSLGVSLSVPITLAVSLSLPLRIFRSVSLHLWVSLYFWVFPLCVCVSVSRCLCFRPLPPSLPLLISVLSSVGAWVHDVPGLGVLSWVTGETQEP